MAEIKKLTWPILAVLVLALAVALYLYFKKPAEKGAVGTAEEISEAVPEIATNPAEEVAEVNPVDQANPFKYKNPLR